MKKFLAAILTLIYFTGSTSATVNVHYCVGEVQSMDFWHLKEKKEPCSNCGMTNKEGCCDDKQHVVKFEKKHNIPVTGFSATKISSVSPRYYPIIQRSTQPSCILNIAYSKSPPGLDDVALFIRNSVFRI